MKNKAIFERIDQAYGYINTLFHIASQLESETLYEFIEENELCGDAIYQYWQKKTGKHDDEFKNALTNLEKHSAEELKYEFVGRNLLGFVAEVKVPVCSNFSFKQGKPISWQSSKGYCRLEYCYAETFEELITTVESVSLTVFNEFVEKEARNEKV
jgi:hypothetical protein